MGHQYEQLHVAIDDLEGELEGVIDQGTGWAWAISERIWMKLKARTW